MSIDLTGDSDTELTTAWKEKKRSLADLLSSGAQYAEARFEWSGRQDASPSTKRAAISKLLNDPGTASPTQFSSSKTSLSSLTAFSLDGSVPEAPSSASKGSVHTTPNSRQIHSNQRTPKQTPNKNDLTSEKLEASLRELSQDVWRDHTKLVNHTIQTAWKQAPPVKQNLSATADLGDLVLEPLDPKVAKSNIMRVKMKVSPLYQNNKILSKSRYLILL